MALDLTNEFIALTFQRLLQIDPNEAAAGFKPFSLSNAINSDSATLINGVGQRINGVVIEQFNQAGLFLKNTNTKFQIYSSTHNSKNGIKFKEYLSNDNVFVTDEGHLYVNYSASYDSSNYSLYVDRGIHLKPISGSAYLKSRDVRLDFNLNNNHDRTYVTQDREMDVVGVVSYIVTDLPVEPGEYQSRSTQNGGGVYGVSDYDNSLPPEQGGGRFGTLKLTLPTLVAGNILRLRMRVYGIKLPADSIAVPGFGAISSNQGLPATIDFDPNTFTNPATTTQYANPDNPGVILELLLNENFSPPPHAFDYVITPADVNNMSQFELNYLNQFVNAIQSLNITLNVVNNQIVMSVDYPTFDDLEATVIFPINPPSLQQTAQIYNDPSGILPPFQFLWQHLESTQNQQNNSSQYTQYGQLIADPDKDIMDSGSYKRKIQNTNDVMYFVNWRRVGNVIHCTGFRSWIPDSVQNPNAIELLPVVTQSHVVNGTPVYTYLYGNGVLRDGYNGSAPVPIICKANGAGSTIVNQDCAVQFYEFDSQFTPIKNVDNGDIRFSFSYDLKN